MKYIPVILLIIILIMPAVSLLTLRKEIGLKQTTEGNLRLKNITIRSSVERNSKPIYFNLSENQKTIRQVQINGSNIIEDFNVRFTFPVIKNSENKPFTVILSSPETSKNEELGINTDTLSSPVIITYHIPASKVQLIFGVYKNLAERILADKIFVITWLTLFTSIVFIIKFVF